MRTTVRTTMLVVTLLSLCLASIGQATSRNQKADKTPSEAAAPAATTTEIQVLEGSTAPIKVVVPLAAGATLPLKYALKPEPSGSWLTLSEAGELKINQPPKLSDPEIKADYEVTDYNNKVVASFPIVMKVVASQTVKLGGASEAGAPRITAEPMYEGGDTVVGSGAPGSPVDVLVTHNDGKTEEYSVDPQPATADNAGEKAKDAKVPAAGSFALEMSSSVHQADAIRIRQGASVFETEVKRPWPLNGEETRAIVGMQAAGASSADQEQNFFFDFFIERPLSRNRGDEFATPWLKTWGNVRVASYPQSSISNQTAAAAAANFATNLGSLKLNQLAQGAEFLAGVEFRIFDTQRPFRGHSEKALQNFSLGAIAAIGATGFFNNPAKNVPVFLAPQPGDPQYATFHQEFAQATSKYVGFTTADYQQFPKQWLVGVRLTTNYLSTSGEPLRSAPAMVSFSIGQNQLITGSHLAGAVGRVEAFYPLPIGQRATKFSGVYLFGSAQMRLTNRSASSLPPLVLQPAPSSVHAYDTDVAIAAVPNTRDVYRLGLGIDFVQVISQWTKAGSDAKTKTPKPTKAAAQ